METASGWLGSSGSPDSRRLFGGGGDTGSSRVLSKGLREGPATSAANIVLRTGTCACWLLGVTGQVQNETVLSFGGGGNNIL